MIRSISRTDFFDYVRSDRDGFMRSIDDLDVYIVKEYCPRGKVLAFREFLKSFAAAQEPSWHPCLDGVPDYHRINNEYPGSWVRARMHLFLFHHFNEQRAIFEDFKDILELKNFLRGAPPDANFNTIPSDGVISRIVSQHYPAGGGYLTEHTDPYSDFALVQTIVQASDVGSDFKEGGLYLRPEAGAEIIEIDPHSEMGDLMVLSPAVRHGITAIDPDRELDWSLDRGRFMILPIMISSDYNANPESKPREA